MKLGLRQNLQHRVSSVATLGGGGGGSLADQVIAFFAGGEEGGVWDFTDAANLATATDGTGAVSNGSAIAYCADLSGNGNHLLQSDAGSRPAWDNSGYADFANDYLTVNWTATAQPLTRLSRVYLGTWANGDRVFASGAATNRAVLLQSTSTNDLMMFAGSSTNRVTVSLSAYHTITEVYNGASSNFRLNGVDTTCSPGTDNVGGLTVGADHDGANTIISMRVSRVLMIDRELTAGELAAAEAWGAEVL